MLRCSKRLTDTEYSPVTKAEEVHYGKDVTYRFQTEKGDTITVDAKKFSAFDFDGGKLYGGISPNAPVIRVDNADGSLFGYIAGGRFKGQPTGVSPAKLKSFSNKGQSKYSIRQNFYKEFDSWDRKDTSISFVTGKTSDALKSIGMKDQEIVLCSSTVLQKIAQHPEMTFETFRNIPELLENPIIVQFSDAIDSSTGKQKYQSSITVLGELYADVEENGHTVKKPVLVSLELLPKNRKRTVVLDFAVIKSAYSKNALQHYINENSILYIDPDKKRTNNWLSLNRLQLPFGENRYGSIRKIAYYGDEVKIQNSENMTDMQKALYDAGLVDEFGTSKRSAKGQSKASEVKYSIRRTENVSYEEQIESMFGNGSFRFNRDDDIYVHGAIQADSKLGLNGKPFFLLKRNFEKSTRAEGKNANYSAHSIGKDTMLRIPEHLENPALYVVGNGRVSVITDEYVKTQKSAAAPLLIGIDPNARVDGQAANEIKSIYGKDDLAVWLKLRAKDSKIYAGEKNKAAALLRDVGLQTSEPVAYATDLTNFILNAETENVKTEMKLSARSEISAELTETVDTALLQGSIDGAVTASPVTREISLYPNRPMYSTRTEYEAMPKQTMSLSGGENRILSVIEGLKSGRKIGGASTFTGRGVRGSVMLQNGFTEADVQNVNTFMDGMKKLMDKAAVRYKFIGLKDVKNATLHYRYDTDGNIQSVVLSAMVNNGEYPVNFDLSTICKKREAMSAFLRKISQNGTLDNGTVELSPNNIFKLNEALKNAGYETACLGCFVESRRYSNLKWAQEFCDKWNKAVRKNNKNATYFGYGNKSFTEDGFNLETVEKIAGAAKKFVEEGYESRMRKALRKYEAAAAEGRPLLEGKTITINKGINKGTVIENTFNAAARERIVKSESLTDEQKDYYLNCNVTELGIADIRTLLENGILAGASVSNDQKIRDLVKSGEVYQHYLQPSDLLTDTGISQLEKLPYFHGVLYGHYGSNTPKLMQGFTPYNSEIALLPDSKNSKTSLVEYLYSIAGVRMQSFSDFQIQNIYDYLQMVGDLAARKLPAHAYTKEISFARLLGMTGIKTNLSVMFDIDPSGGKPHAGLIKYNPLIHKGEYAKIVFEDADGKWVYNVGDYATQRAFQEADPTAEKRFLQSIGFSDAVKLEQSEGYGKNCGIIGVGYSYNHILAMLNDPRIRYIIPYHSSSLPKDIKIATNIAYATDYQSVQNNTKIVSIHDADGNAVKWSLKDAYKRLGDAQAVIDELNDHIHNDGWSVDTKKAQNGHGSFTLYENLQMTDDPKKTVSNYIEWCVKNGTLPVFSEFASHENYYKMVYDFNVYDCITEEYAPQEAVTNTYPTEVDGNVTAGNLLDGDFDSSYMESTITKQMSAMNEYNRNLDSDLDRLAENAAKGKFTLEDEVDIRGMAKKTSYSLRSTTPVVPSSDAWQSTHSEDWFAQHGFPLYRDVPAEQRTANEQAEMDKRHGKHGTQNKSTVVTYRKIFDYLKDRGDNPRILDASSGLGEGTKLGKQAGLDVHDIEPFPIESYHPEWTDYSALQDMVESGEIEPFDVIISNAVLNVLAQDTRDNLVSAMDSLLAPGGQMFVNVIGKDYAGAKNASTETQYVTRGGKQVPVGTVLTQEGTADIGREVFVYQSNSIQKVFGSSELKAYLQDALGEGYIIETPAKAWKNSGLAGTMVVVTKPEAKYSYRGENAKTADRELLRTAMSMEKQGIDNETIRQQTGWFKGRDKKWRSEMDDSTASFDRFGEAQYKREHPEYARYTDLMQKVAYGTASTDDFAEFIRLDKENEDFRSVRTLLEYKLHTGEATLKDILHHNELFDAYPEIGETKVVFGYLKEGISGQYDRSTNTITIKESLMENEEQLLDTLMHEVQHRIQQIEGFSRGASTEYWNRGEHYDSAAQQYRDNRGRLLNRLSAEDRAIYNEYRSVSKQIDDELNKLDNADMELLEALDARSDELYDKLCKTDWFVKLLRYDRLLEGAGEMTATAYYNTAGEIEARDVTERRKMTAEERKNTPPNLGDEDTVFADAKYSARESFADAVDSISNIKDAEYLKAKETYPFVLVMGHTPKTVLEAMDGNGKDRPILIRRDALYLAIRESGVQEGHYHALGKEVLKNLPSYIANPDVILKTDGNAQRRILLTGIPSKSGEGIISIEFESLKDFSGQYDYFNIVVTVFDLHRNYLKGLFTKHNAEVKYEKEGLAQVNPQLYEWLRIFNAKPSNDNIAQGNSGVNFSTRSNTDGVSNRSLLANALETTAQNDIERAKIAEYKAKIDKMNAEEEKLHDLRAQIKALSFAKGKRDAQQLKALRDEATKTANRINTYDRETCFLPVITPIILYGNLTILQHYSEKSGVMFPLFSL